MGDVKLAGMMGLFLGAAVAPAMLIALIAGVLLGAVVIARKGAQEGRKTAVPFGPFLALGRIVAVFVGPAAGRCLRQPLPSLKRRRHDADTPPWVIRPPSEAPYSRCDSPHESLRSPP